MTAADPVDYLSVEDLLEIASAVLGEAQLRDVGLLASAAARPQTTVFGDPGRSGVGGVDRRLWRPIAH